MAQRMQPSVHVRFPPALHEQLRERAAEQGMSLNSLLVALLAGGVGFTLDAPTRDPANLPTLRRAARQPGQVRPSRRRDTDPKEQQR